MEFTTKQFHRGGEVGGSVVWGLFLFKGEGRGNRKNTSK